MQNIDFVRKKVMHFSQIYNWYTTGMTSKYQLGNRQNTEATGHLEDKLFFLPEHIRNPYLQD